MQLLAQEISAIENIEIISSGYDELVEDLRKINKIANLYESNYEFAKKLFIQDLPTRIEWLENEVYGKMMEIDDISKMMELNEIISKFY